MCKRMNQIEVGIATPLRKMISFDPTDLMRVVFASYLEFSQLDIIHALVFIVF